MWLKTGILSLILLLFFSACDSINKKGQFDDITQGYRFSLINWGIKTWGEEIKDFIIFWDKDKKRTEEEKIQLVLHYFQLLEKENQLIYQQEQNPDDDSILQEIEKVRDKINGSRDEVEKILAEQIKNVLMEEGIYNPWNKTHIFFPPIKFRLQDSPKVLVISYRERIETKEVVLLKSQIPLSEIEKIENEIASRGFSALVVSTGGIGSYPSMITQKSLKKTIETIAHEWIHHYLTFRPLGFKYLWWNIAKRGDREIVNLNETAAGIIGKEIADKVWGKYYASYFEKDEKEIKSSQQLKEPSSNLDIATELQKIRREVEKYLSEGEIEKAENYMKEKRDWLESKGYYIRKLNQAYFAFYESYGANPAFQDVRGGIGEKLLKLRNESLSLKDFLNKVGKITSQEDLDELLNKKSP